MSNSDTALEYFARPLVIKASAGTGKTYRLSSRLIALLARSVKPSSILATTFTRKAAGEILARVFTRLADAALCQEQAEVLSADIGLPGMLSDDFSQILSNLVREQHRLRIQTLDSFFVSVCRMFSQEIGAPGSWTILEAAEEEQLRIVSLSEALEAVGSEEGLELLIDITKGAYTKSVSSSLLNRLAPLHQLFQTSAPSVWANFEVPNACPCSLRQVIENMQSADLPRTQKGAVNKNWERAWSTLCLDLKQERFAKTLKTRLLLSALDEEAYFSKVLISDKLKGLPAEALSHVTHRLLRQLERQTKSCHQLLQYYDQALGRLKQQSSSLSFNDIKFLLLSSSLMQEFSSLYYRLDSSIDHLLLDEFQDTSREEWAVIAPLASEIVSSGDGRKSFFCVGDEKQAIYGWRGGARGILSSLVQNWSHANSESLKVSYRSSPQVIEFLNKVFNRLPLNPALVKVPAVAQKWSSLYEEHESAKKEMHGYVEVETYENDSKEVSEDVAGIDVRLEMVASKLRSLLATGETVAILVRKNETVSSIVAFLRNRFADVAISEEGGGALESSPAIECLMSALVFADHPGHTYARFLIANSPLSDYLGLTSFSDEDMAIAASSRLRSRIINDGYGQLLYDLSKKLMSWASHQDIVRMSGMVEFGFSKADSSFGRTRDFIAALRTQKMGSTVASQVRVMNFHQSKGLEFENVILPELDVPLAEIHKNNSLVLREHTLASPSAVSLYADEQLCNLNYTLAEMRQQALEEAYEESLSLLYVALSRAAKRLFVLIPCLKAKSEKDSSEDDAKVPTTLAGVIVGSLVRHEEASSPGRLFSLGQLDLTLPKANRPEASRVDFTLQPLVWREGDQRVILAHRNPSALVTDKTRVFEELRNHPSRSKLRRGQAMHALLEHLCWIEDYQENEEREIAALIRIGFSETEAPELRRGFLDLLKREDTFHYLSRDRYPLEYRDKLEVFRELPFSVRQKHTLVSGRLDRVVLWSGDGGIEGAEVLDFKTSLRRCIGEDPRTMQLDSYARAVSQIFEIAPKKVSCRFVEIG